MYPKASISSRPTPKYMRETTARMLQKRIQEILFFLFIRNSVNTGGELICQKQKNIGEVCERMYMYNVT